MAPMSARSRPRTVFREAGARPARRPRRSRWSPCAHSRQELVGEAAPIATHEIRGGGGLRLHARESGDPQGSALLLVHGLSQSDLCWTKQVNGELAAGHRIITFDIRGHGLSEKPSGPEHYADGKLWADDVAAVIRADRPRAAGRGRLVVRRVHRHRLPSRIRRRGEVGGVNLVGAATILRPPRFDHLGPGLLENAPGMWASTSRTNMAAIRPVPARMHSGAARERARGPRRCVGTWWCHQTCEVR